MAAKKTYGGYFPKMIEGSDVPDLSIIGNAIVPEVQSRKHRISAPGYQMKVRDGYLQNEAEEKTQKIIIKKIIRRRRPAQNGTATQQSNQQQQQLEEQKRQQAAEAERQRQASAAAEAEAERQREAAAAAEVERQRQAAAAAEAEKQRQAAAAAEAERQLQAAAAAEAEKQRQAAAAAAAAPAAAPTQKVIVFQNTGQDPAMAKAELYYESTRWGPLGHGDQPVTVGSFPGHRWFIVANGVYAKLFTVGEDAQQTFTI